jgi:ribosomal protein S3
MKRTIQAGIYSVEMEKTENVVTITMKNPGGGVVATGSGADVRSAADQASEMTADEGARLTLNQVLLPEF